MFSRQYTQSWHHSSGADLLHPIFNFTYAIFYLFLNVIVIRVERVDYGMVICISR